MRKHKHKILTTEKRFSTSVSFDQGIIVMQCFATAEQISSFFWEFKTMLHLPAHLTCVFSLVDLEHRGYLLMGHNVCYRLLIIKHQKLFRYSCRYVPDTSYTFYPCNIGILVHRRATTECAPVK